MIKNILMTAMLPVLLFVLFTIGTGGTFATTTVLMSVARSTVYPCLLCMALSLVMSMGMWDFSAGAVLYLGALIGGNIALELDMGIPGLVICLVAICAVAGCVNGIVYNIFKVPSIVLSIGMCMIYEGFPRIFIDGGFTMKRRLGTLSYTPYCFFVLALATIVYFFILKYTVFGHNLGIIGANQDVAYRSGINLKKTKFMAYVMSGFYIGLACVIYVGQSGSVSVATNLSSASVIFDAMMGFFVANFLSAYCGMAIGVVVGTFCMRMLSTGLIAMGFSSSVNQIFTGFFLLLLLAFSANQYLPAEIKKRKEVAKIATQHYESAAK